MANNIQIISQSGIKVTYIPFYGHVVDSYNLIKINDYQLHDYILVRDEASVYQVHNKLKKLRVKKTKWYYYCVDNKYLYVQYQGVIYIVDGKEGQIISNVSKVYGSDKDHVTSKIRWLIYKDGVWNQRDYLEARGDSKDVVFEQKDHDDTNNNQNNTKDSKEDSMNMLVNNNTKDSNDIILEQKDHNDTNKDSKDIILEQKDHNDTNKDSKDVILEQKDHNDTNDNQNNIKDSKDVILEEKDHDDTNSNQNNNKDIKDVIFEQKDHDDTNNNQNNIKDFDTNNNNNNNEDRIVKYHDYTSLSQQDFEWNGIELNGSRLMCLIPEGFGNVQNVVPNGYPEYENRSVIYLGHEKATFMINGTFMVECSEDIIEENNLSVACRVSYVNTTSIIPIDMSMSRMNNSFGRLFTIISVSGITAWEGAEMSIGIMFEYSVPNTNRYPMKASGMNLSCVKLSDNIDTSLINEPY